MFDALNLTDKVIHTAQTRRNYKYKEVEIALKYSKEWQYHMELEILVSDISEKKVAEEKIHKVATELGIKIMTEEELQKFVKKVEAKI